MDLNLENMSFKKIFLIILLAAFVVGALIAVSIFLFGSFGQTEMKLLLTTIIIGGYSLTGLCSSVLYGRKKYVSVAIAGMIVAALGFLVTTTVVWRIPPSIDLMQEVLLFIVLSGSLAHISMLLLAKSENKLVNKVISLTIISITLLAILLVNLIYQSVFNTAYTEGITLFGIGKIDILFYLRLIGVLAVTNVLGTIATPILLKIASMKK